MAKQPLASSIPFLLAMLMLGLVGATIVSAVGTFREHRSAEQASMTVQVSSAIFIVNAMENRKITKVFDTWSCTAKGDRRLLLTETRDVLVPDHERPEPGTLEHSRSVPSTVEITFSDWRPSWSVTIESASIGFMVSASASWDLVWVKPPEWGSVETCNLTDRIHTNPNGTRSLTVTMRCRSDNRKQSIPKRIASAGPWPLDEFDQFDHIHFQTQDGAWFTPVIGAYQTNDPDQFGAQALFAGYAAADPFDEALQTSLTVSSWDPYWEVDVHHIGDIVTVTSPDMNRDMTITLPRRRPPTSMVDAARPAVYDCDVEAYVLPDQHRADTNLEVHATCLPEDA